jgi:hypothetical protein
MLSNSRYGGLVVTQSLTRTSLPLIFLWRFKSEWWHILPVLDEETEEDYESLVPVEKPL